MRHQFMPMTFPSNRKNVEFDATSILKYSMCCSLVHNHRRWYVSWIQKEVRNQPACICIFLWPVFGGVRSYTVDLFLPIIVHTRKLALLEHVSPALWLMRNENGDVMRVWLSFPCSALLDRSMKGTGALWATINHWRAMVAIFFSRICDFLTKYCE